LGFFHLPLQASSDEDFKLICAKAANYKECIEGLRENVSRKETPISRRIGAYLDQSIEAAKAGEIQIAIDLIEKAISIDENYSLNHTLYVLKGKYHSEMGNYKQAIADYTKAISINPDWDKNSLARSFYQRGVAWEKINKIKKAYKDLEKAVELAPKYHVYVGVKSVFAIRLNYSKDRFCPDLKKVIAYPGSRRMVEMTKDLSDKYCN
tara:strand:+ start:150 stop:773 length:624 start_codon:yes stop_codon:yes gene_type:complete